MQSSGNWETEGAWADDVEWGVLAPIFRRSMFWTPERQARSAWIEHVPFGFWLVDVLRPRRIVELGTNDGVSYSAMCQAIKTLGLATSCYAVDAWKGDEHAGFYGEDVYDDFTAFHDQRYAAFSRLVRSNFDEALGRIENGSIDLLHINGLHTYDTVRHDYQSWLPKLSANAVVLFHNTNVREREFGVFQLWNEIVAGKPHFTFLRGHGLGVLGQGRDYSGALGILFSANDTGGFVSLIREMFGTLGLSVRALSERLGLNQTLPGYSGEISRLRQALAAREDELAIFEQGLSDSTCEIRTLRQALVAREDELATLKQRLSENAGEIDTLQQTRTDFDLKVKAVRGTTSALYASTLCRITTRLQAVKHLLRRLRYSAGRAVKALWRVAPSLRRRVSDAGRFMYRKLPLPIGTKIRLKSALFSLAPFVFRHTLAYRTWEAQRRATAPASAIDEVRWQYVRDAAAVPLADRPMDIVPAVRTIAFYLPQFHPIPENDEFWGRGFTEWTNVMRAVPRFRGHHQPRLPGELGFYDLRLVDIQRRQVELAKLYGVAAFCFHFYWFSGRRLLELPLKQYANSPDLNLPFCICWANENWTRAWDGAETHILIGQRHSPEDDLEFISYVARYLRDPRYVRVGGKPLLIVYRPELLPNSFDTTRRWRDWCYRSGIGEIHLAYVQSFETADPAVYGFDAAIEFPPNNMQCPPYTGSLDDRDPDFCGIVYDWDFFRRRSATYPVPHFRLYRGVCPSWDNEARRPGRGSVVLGSTPERYREWLQNAAADTISRFADPSERLVFINAWNEWAEGAYLEPDQRNGYAYLAATRAALEAVSAPRRPGAAERVALIGHDAHPHGAQFLLLHLVREMRQRFGLEVECVLLHGGPLEADYRAVGRLHLLAGADPAGVAAKSLAADLRARGFAAAIANTTACGLFARTLTEAGLAVVSLVHEHSAVLETYEGRGLLTEAAALAAACDRIVFPNSAVADEFRRRIQIDPAKMVFRPQGLYKRNRLRTPSEVEKARQVVRSEFGWPASTRIVLAVGFGDQRKGVDLFVDVAEHVLAREQDVAFMWVGKLHGELGPAITARRDKSVFAQQIAFAGFRSETDAIYAAADLLVLPSREDPFPSVLLEAFDSKLPAVAFAGVGGFDSLFAANDVGALVAAFDIAAFGDAVLAMMRDEALRQRKGGTAARLVDEEYSFARYAHDLLTMVGIAIRTVSVIVPNYNYCRYVDMRLRSIAAQTRAPFEVIVIDDASSDGSAEWLADNLTRICPNAQLVINTANSGSVFRQWYDGCRRAVGEFVWIAEADDLADREFLETVLKAFDDPDVVLSYCQSRQMASDGTILSADYLNYVADVSPDKWRSDYVVDGLDEIRSALAVKNTIPNVSAVVFRRRALIEALDANLDELDRLRVAGDWLVYLDVVHRGKVAFVARALNSHRRHSTSVTSSTTKLTHLREVMTVQREVCDRFAPPAAARAAATAYAEVLYRKLGLATREAPTAADHPELASLMTPMLEAARSIRDP
jgi:hypothetical protein